MAQERQLYRSRNALVGGVSAGIAEYFHLDTVIVRILVVVFTLLSGGLLLLGYALLWIILKREPKQFAPLDVEPDEVHSETYGAVSPRCGACGRPRPGERAGRARFAGTGHVPPEPPRGAVAAAKEVRTAVGASGDAATGEDAADGGSAGGDAAGRPASSDAAPAAAASDVTVLVHVPSPSAPTGVQVGVGLTVGGLVVFALSSTVASHLLEGVEWWMLWPLLLEIFGIVRMVVPSHVGHRMDGFVAGIVAFSFGVTMLPMSVGLLSWDTIGAIVRNLWPAYCAVLALMVWGKAADKPMAKLAGGLLFLALCLVGLVLCGEPGAVPDLAVEVPAGARYHLSDVI